MKNIAIRHFHSEPLRKKKSRWKLWLVFLLLLACAGSIIYTVNLDGYQIKNIEIKGAVLTDTDRVQDIVEQSIAGKYFYLIPKAFFWGYPKSEIRDQIEALLSVLNVDIERESNTLNITLAERTQKYLWCMEDKSQCYYMDDKGLIFTRAPLLEGSAFITFLGLILAEPLGQYFLPEEKMLELLKFLGNLTDLDLQSKSVKAVSHSEVHIILGSGTDLIISFEKSLDTALQNLQILRGSSDFASASGGIESLKYIDLRYGTKAFWK